MARAIRRGRGGRTSPRIVVLLGILAVSVFVGGMFLLHGRSDDGTILRARLGLPVDRAELTRVVGRIAHRTFAEFGVPLGAQVAKDRQGRRLDALEPGDARRVDRNTDRPPVVWTVYLPGRASTFQLNARLTESLAEHGAQVLDAWEDTLATPASEVHLYLGAGRIATHEIVLERRTDAIGARGYESARLMLVLDLLGSAESDSLARTFLDLDVALTGAVLPESRSTRDWARRLAASGDEVLLQIPMEPLNYPQRDPGPGAVLVDMPSGQIQRLVKKHLSQVSPVAGATSYMGTMALSDVAAMTAVMTELKRAGVYFLDLRTIPGSIAAERAADEGVVCFRVDERLEAPGRHDAQVRTLTKQLASVVDLARRRGYAIVLVHPDRATIAVLRREVPKLLRSGVRFDRLSVLLKQQAF